MSARNEAGNKREKVKVNVVSNKHRTNFPRGLIIYFFILVFIPYGATLFEKFSVS